MTNEEKGYPNAGALIGILERCIILLLLYMGQYSAIGFVPTAKSIARYNRIADDPKFSEYYLLGTLFKCDDSYSILSINFLDKGFICL